MKVSGTTISALAVVALGVAAGSVWSYRDYHRWLALGPGGLPHTFRGWLMTTWMRRLKGNPLDTGRFAKAAGGPGDNSFLDQLPKREGPRPTIGVHPVPHRQLDQLPGAEMNQKIVELFDALVRRRSEIVHYQLSFFERRNQAVFLREPNKGHADAETSHGEIAHVHPSDGSMHMIFSPRDAKKVIEAAWGECHPLAGRLNLPDTYLLLYPPRDEREIAVTARLLDAAVGHMAMLAAPASPQASSGEHPYRNGVSPP